MTFITNSSQQISLTDHTLQLTKRERTALEKSWARYFSENIFPKIKEEDFSVLYSSKISRPNAPVNVMMGALILKEIWGLTDEEIVQSLMFDIRFQYALRTTSFSEQPLSTRSLSRFRSRNLAYRTETGNDLIHACVTSLTEELREFVRLSFSMRPLDSLAISANISSLSMAELFYTCTANLAKQMNQRGTALPEEQAHYLIPDDHQEFSGRITPKKSEKLLSRIFEDGEILLSLCSGDYDDTSEYQLLLLLFDTRTTVSEDGMRRIKKQEADEDE